jgi:signal transduction histidine kinase
LLTNNKILKKYIVLLLLFSLTSWSQIKGTLDSIVFYDNNGDYLKGILFTEKQCKKLLQQKKLAQFCDLTLKKAAFYTKLKDNTKGVTTLFEALKIIDKQKMPVEKILIHKRIADIYYQALNVKKSFQYYQIAAKTSKKIKNDTLLAFVYQGVFKIYIEGKNKDSLKFYANEILRLSKDKGGYDLKTTAHNNLYAYYTQNNQIEIAKKHLDSSFNYANQSKNSQVRMYSYSNLAYYYMVNKKNYKKAEKLLLKIIQLYKTDTLNIYVTDQYLNLSYVYEQMNDFKTANFYLNKYRINSETTYNNQQNKQIQDIETRYKIKEAQDVFNQKEVQLKEQQKRRQLFFLIVTMSLVMLIILIAIFYQNNKLKQKNKLNEIESHLKENLINATIDGQESERKNIASVLHDNVSALLSSANIQLMVFSASQSTKSEEIVKAQAIINDAHDKVRDLSHKLVPTLLTKFGLIYSLKDLCEKNSSSMIAFSFISDINVKKRFNEEFEMKLYFILSEMVNNVLKHSQATEASITIIEENQKLCITVKDNGKGFKITKDKRNEGFGLTQIRARVNNINGKLTLYYTINHGTTIGIEVPIIYKPSTPIA